VIQDATHRLRRWCVLLYLGLLAPSAVLVWQGANNLRYQSFHSAHALAEGLAQRIGDDLRRTLAAEQARAATDYEFFVMSGDQYLQRSPLADLAPAVDLPGLVGFFQVDPTGRISTPFEPQAGQEDNAALSPRELADRRSQASRLRSLVAPAAEGKRYAAPAASGEEKRLESAPRKAASPATLDELEFNIAFDEAVAQDDARVEQRSVTQEARRVPQDVQASAAGALPPGIASIVAEVDPLILTRLDDAHLIAHRRVYIDGQIRVQGFVMALEPFIERYFADAFLRSPLASTSEMIVALNNEVLDVRSDTPSTRTYQPPELNGTLLLRTRLPAPANGIELVFNARELPLGAGAGTLLWTAAALFILLSAGIYLLYRLGRRHILLAGQQRDFVAAVSHELKTPLTAIRMYGEILRAGWADEEKKRTYYDFIYHESERLSRLVASVLQLARLENGNSADEPLVERTVAELFVMLREKSANLAETEGFDIAWVDASDGASVMVAEDAWIQVMINLLDNGIKFSRDAERQELTVSARADAANVTISVRDYGPGVPKAQLKQIFEMFYRAESELTRETRGTGIGLSLVRGLVARMNGTVDVANRSPGAEFSVRLPRA
jgi:signal transduction histidine kinase